MGRAFSLANGNFILANTHISVCSFWTIPILPSVRSGQYPYFGLFGHANTFVLAFERAFVVSLKTRAGAFGKVLYEILANCLNITHFFLAIFKDKKKFK